MIAWVLRVILLLIVIRLVWRFLAGVMDGMAPPSASGRNGKAGQTRRKSVPLVRDPVCGTHVVPNPALALRAGKQTQYFCSERCRDEYEQRSRLREAK
jgi:YHS domain-containing protein